MAELNIYYQNVRGLRSKTNSLFRNISMNSYDVIIFTETWLVDDIHNSELFDSRYLVWRRDREYSRTAQKRGGGVLIAVKRELIAIEKPNWRSSAEDIWVSLILKRNRPQVSYKLHLCALYLCKENLGHSYYTQLNNFTTRLSELTVTHPLDKFVILGDFNFGNDVNWICSHGCELIPNRITNQQLVEFFDAVTVCNLSQYNGERNINNRLLDLVFSNDTLTVTESINPLAIPVDAHHKPLVIATKFVEIHRLCDKITKRFIFSRGDYSAIKSELDKIDWPLFLLTQSIEDAVSKFYGKLYELRNKHVPQKSVRQSYHPPWFDSALIKTLKEKLKYHRKFKTYGNLSDYNSFFYSATQSN